MLRESGKLVLVTHALGGGGAERVVAWLAGELVRRDWRVTLLVIGDVDEGRYDTHPRVVVKCLRLERPSSGVADAVVTNLKRVRAVRRALRTESPDVVVSFGDTTNVTTLLAATGTRTPVVVSERTEPRRHVIPSYWSRLRRWTYPRAFRVVVQTESVASWAKTFVPASRVVVVRNAALRRAALGPSWSDLPELFVLGVGRLEPVKRFDALIRSFAAVHGGHGPWHLVLAGDGSQGEALREIARKLGVESRVRLLGRVRDIDSVYDRAAIFCLTSAYEGYPNALLEAMRAGVACLSVDCLSGPSEIIENDVDGLIVPEHDEPALVDALSRLMRDSELRKRLGTSARLRVAGRTPEAAAMEWQSLLLQATGRATRPGAVA